MGSFSNSPRLLKAAIVGIDLFNPLASIIVLQYNPESLTRTIQPQTIGNEEGARTDVLRLTGAPIETIRLDAELDATDQLEQSDPIATTLGIHPQLSALVLEQSDRLATTLGIYPQLSALEMLVYPKTAKVIFDTALM